MKRYLKYISPLLLCGLIIFILIHISTETALTFKLHTADRMHALTTANIGAARYLFYKHMFVNVLTH